MQKAVVMLVVAAVAFLGALHTTSASILSRPSMDNNLDNEITINNPVAKSKHRYFLEISSGPTPTHHSAGTTSELKCQAMGSPVPNIMWLKNGRPILQEELETNEIIVPTEKAMATVHSTLQIIGMSPSKEDVYTCVAHSSLTTKKASTTVYNDLESISPMFSSLSELNRELLATPRKPTITHFAPIMMAFIENLVVLPCKATGNPMPEITWERVGLGRSVTSDDRVRVLESGDLVIADARWSDMDSYNCIAKNSYGHDSVTTFFYPFINESSKHYRPRK